MTEERIRIEKLAFGGSGVGRISGKVCFVPYSCPGDELTVRITSEKRSYVTAAIIEVITPGDDRVTPPCPLFGSCGGCSWQHVAYGRQLAEKRQIFAETLWRGGRIPGELIGDIVASPANYGYRSRVQLKLNADNGKLRIGFYRQGTHFVDDVCQGCPVAVPVVNQVLAQLRELLRTFPEPTRIPQISIDAAEQGVVTIVSYIGSDRNGTADFFNKRRDELENVTGLYLQTGKKSTFQKVFGNGELSYSLPSNSTAASPCSLSYRPGAFAQVNTLQNSALLRLVQTFADCSNNDRVLDLYCGNGNFSLPLAGSVSSITGIEEYADSIAAAQDNSRHNGITNAEFICADAAVGIKRLIHDGRYFETVILDPPRSGAVDVLSDILRLKPERIIYVSCDPSTLARDCGVLSAGGYGVESSVPVDMFPQTYHLESVTLLKLRPRS
ncbi:MAG: 23S rRNA (uracil(1939)-C(5))-methyltransferase RlmD [Desulfuromonadales bacterium]|nr:23S rRNA (uracil(1939)-C(5))-methyltransferase RlmD [Desulfuromonadales bacterium]